MKRKLYLWQCSGFLFTGITGTLLHFVYDWSKGSRFAALFSGVNESVWEHMKLLFFPMFVFALLENVFFGKKYGNFMQIRLRGILLGLMLIPVIYYTYLGAFGVNADWFNICIFFIASASAYFYETRALLRESKALFSSPFAMVILFLIAALFFMFTFFPPQIPLFRDPVTGQYGIA